jgi:hypothetical protein
MELRNYVILKANDRTVHEVYICPRETSRNTHAIALSLDRVTRYLVGTYYRQGYDVLIARGHNLKSVRKSMPELRWSNSQTHYINSFLANADKSR